jgi:GT2 family glycosyltransferase
MTKSNSIDLIVPVYKNVALTKACLDSILKNVDEIKHLLPRLIVINDSPDDEEVSRLLLDMEKEHKSIKLLVNKKNVGFVKSVNSGLALSRNDGRDVILINSDTQTFPGTLLKLVEAAYSDPQIGFASPRSNNAAFCSFPHVPHPFGGVLPTPQESYSYWKTAGATLPKFHFAPTAVGFYLYIKHQILLVFGELSEDFGLGYEEENDLILRANKVGFRAVIANESFAYHAGSASFSLRDLDLSVHKNKNLQKMMMIHPEFVPMVRRYESAPHYSAERMLGGLIKSKTGTLKLLVDLSGMSCNHNGTNELAVGIVRQISQRWNSVFDLTVLCSKEAFEFHKIKSFGPIVRVDLTSIGLHAIAVRLGQPFDMHHINVLEVAAPINIFGMLDVIAEDCGHLSITHRLADYWDHVARHANGVFYISKFAGQTFRTRFPAAKKLPAYTKLLPTKVESYAKTTTSDGVNHVLVLGNHFPHKAADITAEKLGFAYPSTHFVVMGAENYKRGNVQGYRAGELDQDLVESLFSNASVVVLPSFVEGFGFGFMHALAAKKPIVARNIEATAEIMETFASTSGIYLFNDANELAELVARAMEAGSSQVDDQQCIGWDGWVDGFMEFCQNAVSKPDIYEVLAERIRAGNYLRKVVTMGEQNQLHKAISAAAVRSDLVSAGSLPPDAKQPEQSQSLNGSDAGLSFKNMQPAESLLELLSLDGEVFIASAYVSLLRRPPDVEGLKHHLDLLGNGVTKMQIVEAMCRSSEAASLAT